MNYLPLNIDVEQILTDLASWGWRDFKIELACDFTQGYVNHLRNGTVRTIGFHRAARLHNFWLAEQEKTQGLSQTRMETATT